MNVELARWDLPWQSDSLFKLVSASRKRALKICVGLSCLLADIESTSEEFDQAELDDNVCKGSILNMSSHQHA